MGRPRTMDDGRWTAASGLLVFLFCFLAPTAAAQETDIIHLYKQERARVLAERILQHNQTGAEPLPVAMLPVPQVEHLRDLFARVHAEPEAPAFRITAIYLASNLQRGWYEERFEDVDWTFIGATYGTRLDTMMTREIRARLQGVFGDPTEKLGDLLRDEVIEETPPQFEYKFMLNGSIPLRIMDVNGPFERGLVAATSRAYRDSLLAIRQSFLQRILTPEAPAPYADYYYEPVTGQWFVTGFDGDEYHLRPADPPGRYVGVPNLESNTVTQ